MEAKMIKFPKHTPPGVKKILWERDVDFKLEGITRSEARLHKIKLFSRNHGYRDLTKLGNFKDASNIGWQNPIYDKKYMRQFQNFYIIAFVNPEARYYPSLSMSIHPKRDISPEEHKRFLTSLSLLPDLNVSEVEYAVDLFCSSPDHVRTVFELIKKCLFIRRQRKINIIDNSRRRPYPGRVYHLGKSHKVYERGQDFQQQQGNYWLGWNLDRVRLEFTAKQTPLKNHGINTLQDLIHDPKFIYVNWDKYLFKHFDFFKKLRKCIGPYGKRFPAPWESYRAKDNDGNSGAFHLEYSRAKETLKNVSPYLRDPFFFDELQSLLYESMGRFGMEWRQASI
jgi:hypothetical protein